MPENRKPPVRQRIPALHRSLRLTTPPKPPSSPRAGPASGDNSEVPEMTEEESRRRGDAADGMMQEIKRRIAAKVRK